MEICEGGPVIQQGGFTEKLPLEVVRVIMQALLSLICKVHEEGYVHRDIRPDNILVSDKKVLSSVNQVKLIDFSSGCEVLDDMRCQRRCGTLGFMAPELLKGNELSFCNNMTKCDFFSLGATFYKFLYGKLPFLRNTSKQLLQSNKNFLIFWDTRFWDKMPSALFDLIESMLESDPAKRPTCAKLLQHPFLVENIQY